MGQEVSSVVGRGVYPGLNAVMGPVVGQVVVPGVDAVVGPEVGPVVGLHPLVGLPRGGFSDVSCSVSCSGFTRGSSGESSVGGSANWTLTTVNTLEPTGGT